MLKFPIIGPILNKAAIARYARTLSTMFSAGVPLVEALDSVAGATRQHRVRERGAEDARRGRHRPAPAARDGEHGPVPEHGQPDDRGRRGVRLAGRHVRARWPTFYEAEVDNAVDAMSSLLEPLIMAGARRAGRRPRDRDVPADLQARLGGVNAAADVRRRSSAAHRAALSLGTDAIMSALALLPLRRVCHRPRAGLGPDGRQLSQRRHSIACRSCWSGEWREQCADFAGADPGAATRARRDRRTLQPRRAALGLPALQGADHGAAEHPAPSLARPAGPLRQLRHADLRALSARSSRSPACSRRPWPGGSASAGRCVAALLLTWFLIAMTFIDIDTSCCRTA